METVCFSLHGKKKNWFKSYYVVWKLEDVIPELRVFFPFKSYYVVWKPVFSFRMIDHITKFKSYYVVWKLLRSFQAGAHHLFGLNRTM